MSYTLIHYIVAHDTRHLLPPAVLSLLGGALIALIHTDYPLPIPGILGFFSLWGFFQTLSISQCFSEDYIDGTFDMLTSDGAVGFFKYVGCRLMDIFICFSVPLILSFYIATALMSVPTIVLYGLIINHIHTLIGIAGLQIALNLTAQNQQKMTVLFLFFPFWIPSFLYLIHICEDTNVWLPLVGLTLFQMGISLLLTQSAMRWRQA